MRETKDAYAPTPSCSEGVILRERVTCADRQQAGSTLSRMASSVRETGMDPDPYEPPSTTTAFEGLRGARVTRHQWYLSRTDHNKTTEPETGP